MLNTEQKGTSQAENPSLGDLELKANLNQPQREYLGVLKDKMKKILGHKTKQELARAGDLASLKRYKAILEEILDFLRTKKMFREIEHLEPGAVEVLETKKFTEEELIGVILEAENYVVEPENIRCIRETRTAENDLVNMDFIIKNIPHLEYHFQVQCKHKPAMFLAQTTMDKVFWDANDQIDSVSTLAHYVSDHGRWFYEISSNK